MLYIKAPDFIRQVLDAFNNVLSIVSQVFVENLQTLLILK